MLEAGAVVLVTGCSRGGIGGALCKEFTLQGCKVYATARNIDSIEDFGLDNLVKLRLDVTSDEDIQQAIRKVMDTEGRIDVVVNNAGRIGAGPLLDQPVELLADVFNTNTFSVLRICKAVVPHMAKRKSGLIVNVGSIVGETPTPWNGLYSASKAALHNMTEVLSVECRPLGVDVMLVSPGAVQSNIAKTGAAQFSLPPDSLYTAFLPNIIARIYASQSTNRMPRDLFAQRVVSKVLSRHPPTYLTLGGNSFVFSVLKWLPRSWALSLLWYIHSRPAKKSEEP